MARFQFVSLRERLYTVSQAVSMAATPFCAPDAKLRESQALPPALPNRGVPNFAEYLQVTNRKMRRTATAPTAPPVFTSHPYCG